MEFSKSKQNVRKIIFMAQVALAFCLVSAFTSVTASADEVEIPINNASFDDGLDIFHSATFLNVPDWSQTGNGGADAYSVGNGREPLPTNGIGVCRLFTYTVDDTGTSTGVTHYVHQTVVEEIEPNTEYTLTFDVGNPSGGNDENVVISAYLDTLSSSSGSGASGFSWSLPLTAVPDGNFLLDRKVTYKSKQSGVPGSQPLTIVFMYENTGDDSNDECMEYFYDFEGKMYCYTSISYIDNVRLTARSLRPDNPGKR